MRWDSGDTGRNAETNVVELTQLFHSAISLLPTGPLWVENGFGVVKDYENFLGGEKRSKGDQVLGVFYTGTDYFGEAPEKVGAGSWELVATNKSTVIAKPFLDATVVEDSQCDGCFPDATRTDESDWSKVFRETNDLPNPLVASKTGPRYWGR